MNSGVRKLSIAGILVLPIVCIFVIETSPPSDGDSTVLTLEREVTRPARDVQRTQEHLARIPLAAPTEEHAIRGNVTFADGTAAKANVCALLDSGTLLRTRAPKGYYEFRPVSGREVVLWCRVEGYPQRVEEVQLTDDRVQTFNFRLPPLRRVALRVETPGGTPVQSDPRFRALSPSPVTALHAVSTRAPPETPLPLCARGIHSTYGAGRYVGLFSHGAVTVPPRCLGVLLLADEGPFYVSLVYGHDVIETQEGSDSGEVVFQLRPEQLKALATRLTLQVRSRGTREECRSARARLDLGTARGSWYGADDRGTVDIPAPATGLYTLIVEAQGHASVEAIVSLAAGETKHLGTMELSPSVTIAGRIASTSGESRAGTIYCIDPTMGDVPALLQRRRFPVSEDGRFHIRDAPSGRVHLVIVTRGGLRTAVTLDTSAGDIEGLIVDVPAPQLAILEAAGNEMSEGVYTLFDSQDRPLWTANLSGGELTAIYLAPGRYVAHLKEHALSPAPLASAAFEVDGSTPWVVLPSR